MPFYNQADTTIPNFTWGTKPAAGEFGKGQVFISDVGIYGSLWVSNGSTWAPTGPIVLHNTYYGIIFPSLVAANAATYSQSGTTLTCTSTAHNIPSAGTSGKSVYLTPGTPSTGAQLATGLYTNFTYVDANTFTCTSTVSQTGTGPLNTQTSAIVTPGVSVTVPGNLLGLNGFLDATTTHMCNASAGTKRFSFLYDTLVFKNPIVSSSNIAFQDTHRVQNVNSAAKQIAYPPGGVGFTGGSTIALSTGTIDSTVNKLITGTLTLGSASDYITLEHLTIISYPG